MSRASIGLRNSLLALAIAGLLGACGQDKKPPEIPPAPVNVIELKPTSAPMTTELVGETAGYRDVEVRARVSGILLKRTYTEGQAVQAGQVLFEIDPEPYKAALDQAKGVLAQEQAKLAKAVADRDRIIPLFKENAVSRKDHDDAIAAYNAAIASNQSAQARVKEAELNLGYTKVTAPISGMTSKVAQSEGSLISASGESGLLTTISQFDPLYVNFSYSEQDRLTFERLVSSGKLAMKDASNWTARLRLADGRMYGETGKLNFSDNRVDPKTGTIRARAIFDNKQGELLPGQFVRVILDLGTRQDTLMVPERAIVQSQADRLVMTVNAQNEVVPRPVRLGPTIDGLVVVEEGLKAGEKVIVEGLMKARPGSKVAPSVASAAAASAVAAQ
ncbi:efflux RND transporter periplasmic adaptor subunit [Chitinilyticum litopenaei]|uniref:efflux RND transporter periplasmic adaptor subunit n=1 Tax=Chitinilyticum litopenaei TaxID=1121276 RepID=UPI00040CAE35|nr:efflux RND transporter periplasmic adaptor subunit [Chitinilyticum litopenaei]